MLDIQKRTRPNLTLKELTLSWRTETKIILIYLASTNPKLCEVVWRIQRCIIHSTNIYGVSTLYHLLWNWEDSGE